MWQERSWWTLLWTYPMSAARAIGANRDILRAFSLQFQLLGLLWMVWDIPTTALCTSQRLELVVQLCSALLHYKGAVSLVTVVGGSFPMELKWWEMAAYHTTELEYEILEHYISIATLWLPQQGSSAVMYLLLVVHLVIHRASMWGYTLAQLVSPVHWVSGWLFARSI